MTDPTITPERPAGMQQLIADTGLTRDEQRELLVAVRSLQADIARKDEALRASEGYLLNAKIDLETGARKATAIRTIEGALLIVRAAVAPEAPVHG